MQFKKEFIKQRLSRNINLSYSRGKESAINDGVKTLKLEDPYAVLDDIKQTPRYWRKSKYEMFAKLDNFGPFHFFFTLSCADLRWDENFAAILRAKKCTISVMSALKLVGDDTYGRGDT